MDRFALLVAVVVIAGCSSVEPAAATDASADSAALEDVADTLATLDTLDTTPADSGDHTSCSGPGTCYLVPKLRTDSCCPTNCGVLGKDDSEAIARGRDKDYRKATCGDKVATCDACVSQVSPGLLGACVSGSCAVVELNNSTYSACANDSDCELRFPGCCESCSGETSQLLALSKTARAAFLSETCPPGGGAPCPPCVPSYPAGYKAVCDATTKHCKVQAP